MTPLGKSRSDDEIAARERWLAQRLLELSPEERRSLREAVDLLSRIAGT